MTDREIKAELILRGITMTSIAKSLGCSLPAVFQVIAGTRKSQIIRQGVAQSIGKEVSEVWPEAKPTNDQG